VTRFDEFDEADARARVGTVFNRKYRIERIVGVGGMATVYEGIHRNGDRVAIKMLHPHLARSGEFRARFLREGYVANRVRHRGAVRVLDDDTAEDGVVFLVMDLLEGQTLDAIWSEAGGQLPDREVCELGYQLLDVLVAAHAQGVVHRDLKPENLFLTTEGTLKVLDFGISRLRESNMPATATRTGRMMGTPAYLPPEQALGRWQQVDGQTDLWAAGATMFTLISGQFVHQAETVQEMLVYAGSRSARRVASVAPALSPEVAAVIDRALSFDKVERWRDARTMANELARAYAMTYGVHIPGSRGSRPPGKSDPPVMVTQLGVVPTFSTTIEPASDLLRSTVVPSGEDGIVHAPAGGADGTPTVGHDRDERWAVGVHFEVATGRRGDMDDRGLISDLGSVLDTIEQGLASSDFVCPVRSSMMVLGVRIAASEADASRQAGLVEASLAEWRTIFARRSRPHPGLRVIASLRVGQVVQRIGRGDFDVMGGPLLDLSTWKDATRLRVV
jgi:serine/threonine-protein kinase